MRLKQAALFLTSITAFCAAVYGGPIIEEKDVPMPEVQVELPSALVGEFVVAAPVDEAKITIYPSNKYIAVIKGNDYTEGYTYGHVVSKGIFFYFDPIKKGSLFRELTKIYVSDDGFAYKYTDYDRKEYLIRVVRRVSVPENPPDITIEKRKVKRQYFVLSNNITKTVNEIFALPFEFWYSLSINNGFVVILDEMTNNTGHVVQGQLWTGFLQIESRYNEDFTGTIQFTNTPGYYHSADGTARIEKRGESIKITMLCSLEMETLVQKKYPDAQPPFYMVMEF